MSRLGTSSAVWLVKTALVGRLVEYRDAGRLPGVSVLYSLPERDAQRTVEDTVEGQIDSIALATAASTLEFKGLGVAAPFTEVASLIVSIEAQRPLGDQDEADAGADRMLCAVLDIVSQDPNVGLDPYAADFPLGNLTVRPASWVSNAGWVANKGGTRVGHAIGVDLTLQIESSVVPVADP